MLTKKNTKKPRHTAASVLGPARRIKLVQCSPLVIRFTCGLLLPYNTKRPGYHRNTQSPGQGFLPLSLWHRPLSRIHDLTSWARDARGLAIEWMMQRAHSSIQGTHPLPLPLPNYRWFGLPECRKGTGRKTPLNKH